MARGAVRLVLVALILTTLAGCGSGAWNDPYPVSETEANIFYGAFTERPKHLDPVRAYSSDEYLFIAQVYEPPLQYHYLERPYRLIPLAARALPREQRLDASGQVLPAGGDPARVARSVYRVRLRPGMRYQPHPALARLPGGGYRYHDLTEADLDGVHALSDFPEAGTREVTAADYVYQIKRLANPRLSSPITGLMAEHILGMHEYGRTLEQASGRDGWLDLRDHPHPGVRALDRYTFEITLRGVYPQFRYWLAMPFFAPMPWEADRFYSQPGMAERNISLDWYPLGSGPYMLVRNDPNRRMVLARNPNYPGEAYPATGEPEDRARGLLADAGRAMPFIDRAVYSLEKEQIPYWAKFLQGYYDTSAISSDSFDQAIQLGAQGDPELTPILREKRIRLTTAVATSIYYTGFNLRDPVIGGYGASARRLRQALSIALDFEEYISIFANGRGIPAQGPIPPGISGYREGRAGINPYVYDWKDGAPRRKPIAVARRLLAEAGYPGGRDPASGRPLVLYLDARATGPDDKARLDWLRKQFDRLGIRLVVRASDYNRFREKMRKGTAQIFQWGWNADYPDPENFLFLLYGPNGKVEHGGENASNYRNPDFDGLYLRMKDMPDGAERQAVIDRMLAIVRRDAPWAWGFHPKDFALSHHWYSNVKPNLMANNTLKYRRIDPLERARARLAWNRPRLWPVGVLLGLLGVSAVPAVLAYRRRERATGR